jgi:gamma-glutamyltranspeptidase/glutathione hydrolase
MPRCPTFRATGLPPAVLLLAGLLAGCGAPRPTEPPSAGPGYRGGIVAVANPHAAEAGARILERGGNAVDAAVAIAYALNVVEPQSAGIGGGGFMMVHLAQQDRTLVIDSRETAPAGATRDMFVGVPDPSLQGVAVGVPGMVRGTAHALRHHGRLGLAEVLQSIWPTKASRRRRVTRR